MRTGYIYKYGKIQHKDTGHNAQDTWYKIHAYKDSKMLNTGQNTGSCTYIGYDV
jgi:hypothetical protein